MTLSTLSSEVSMPRLAIYCRKADGSTFRAFVWTRDAASGIARALRESPQFGYTGAHRVIEAWAEELPDSATG